MWPAIAGGSIGALLGQASDALSYPRQQLMQALGLPETGSALLQQLLGADPNDPLTQLGGAGVEMATDPLSYLGFLGGALRPLFQTASGIDRMGDVATLQRAAQQAKLANEASGMGLWNESLQRMGRAVTPDDVAAFGPRSGLYARNPTRTTAMEAGNTVSPNVMQAGGQGRGAINQARQAAMAQNASYNDQILGAAMDAYDEPFAYGPGQTMALPGMMLSPQNPMRSNILARLNPDDALAGIEPLMASMSQAAARQGQLSPWEMALLSGVGGGAIGGGIYAGAQ